MSLETLLQRPDLWRGRNPVPADNPALSTGIPSLDQAIGGWPRGRLMEFLGDPPNDCDLDILLPALARLSQEGRWLLFIAPPALPYPQGLLQRGIGVERLLVIDPPQGKELLWALERALRAGCCGAVLAWPSRLDFTNLRRLQLAAEEGDTLGVLYRPERAATQPSPAALRLQVYRHHSEQEVRVLKQRGNTGMRTLRLPYSVPDIPLALAGHPSAPSGP